MTSHLCPPPCSPASWVEGARGGRRFPSQVVRAPQRSDLTVHDPQAAARAARLPDSPPARMHLVSGSFQGQRHLLVPLNSASAAHQVVRSLGLILPRRCLYHPASSATPSLTVIAQPLGETPFHVCSSREFHPSALTAGSVLLFCSSVSALHLRSPVRTIILC